MVNAWTKNSLALRKLTIDYSSGHVLIDGRPIGCFVAEQGPEVVASPFKDLYIVNVPLMVESVTFLPSGERFERARGVNEAWEGAAERIRAIDALIRTKKAERERDDALGRLDRVRDERDEATTLSVQVVRERDEAVSREFNLRNAIRNHPAMRGTVGLYQSSDEEFVDAVTGRIARMADEADERDEWRERAEKAEARITVTRADIENAIQSCRIVQPYADNVMYVEVDEVHERLFGVADHDPVEAKAEELWRAVNGTLNDWETEDSGIREEFRLIAAHVLWSDR